MLKVEVIFTGPQSSSPKRPTITASMGIGGFRGLLSTSSKIAFPFNCENAPEGDTTKREYYLGVLHRIWDAVCRKRQELLASLL